MDKSFLYQFEVIHAFLQTPGMAYTYSDTKIQFTVEIKGNLEAEWKRNISFTVAHSEKSDSLVEAEFKRPIKSNKRDRGNVTTVTSPSKQTNKFIEKSFHSGNSRVW